MITEPWYLIIPILLSALYSRTEYSCTAALGFPAKPAGTSQLFILLSNAALTVSWSAYGYHLTLFYILAYGVKAMHLLNDTKISNKNWFLLNLSYINSMLLHQIFIAVISLWQGAAMQAILASPLIRTASVSLILTINIVENLIMLKHDFLFTMLDSEAQSAEVRPFMGFLWFCTAYLLVDSLMCIVEPEPLYPPLFLAGSCIAMMFILVRFLTHIYDIITSEHLKDENAQLTARLQETEQSTGTLRRLAERDLLTGAYSRRYVMERIEAMIDAGNIFTLIFIDLDGLKALNDREGHDSGDLNLSDFTSALRTRLRSHDLLARIGGDEFIVLMPGCNEDTAEKRIEYIRNSISKEKSGNTPFRFSYGTATMHAGSVKEVTELLKEADQAMYQDKKSRC